MWACLTYFKLNAKSLKQKHLCEAYNIRFAPFIQTHKSHFQTQKENVDAVPATIDVFTGMRSL